METVPLVERDKATNQSERKVSFTLSQRSTYLHQSVLGPGPNKIMFRSKRYVVRYFRVSIGLFHQSNQLIWLTGALDDLSCFVITAVTIFRGDH